MDKILYQTFTLVDATSIAAQISSKHETCVLDITQFGIFDCTKTDVKIFLNHEFSEISKQKYVWKAHRLDYSRVVPRLFESACKPLKPFVDLKRATNDRESHTSSFSL